MHSGVLLNVTPVEPRAPRPKGNSWAMVKSWSHEGDIIHAWRNGTILALSSRHAAVESHKSKLVVPSFQLSISDRGRRPSDEVIRGVLADFDLEGAEEDNHSPGVARHFWLDEGRSVQPECECKKTEEIVVEPDGYQWQRDRGDR